MRRSLPRPDPNNAETRPPRSPTRRKVIAWAWVFAWALVIWTLGTDDFSFEESSNTIYPWLDWLTGDLDWRTRYQIYVAIRKCAHFTEYAILALLTFRAALIAAARTPVATAAWVALFMVACLAAADEARQSFSAVRTGSPYDVLIDVSGGLVMVLGLVVIVRRLRSPDAIRSSA
jgi:VanZ family protein